MIPATHSKPALITAIPVIKNLLQDAMPEMHRDAIGALVILALEVGTSHGDSVTIKTTEE